MSRKARADRTALKREKKEWMEHARSARHTPALSEMQNIQWSRISEDEVQQDPLYNAAIIPELSKNVSSKLV